MSDIYQENSYADRKEYLVCLSKDYGVPFKVVRRKADELGYRGDFEGLISYLEEFTNPNIYRLIRIDDCNNDHIPDVLICSGRKELMEEIRDLLRDNLHRSPNHWYRVVDANYKLKAIRHDL